MRVELTESESVAEPRLWVEHQQVLALVRPGPETRLCDRLGFCEFNSHSCLTPYFSLVGGARPFNRRYIDSAEYCSLSCDTFPHSTPARVRFAGPTESSSVKFASYALSHSAKDAFNPATIVALSAVSAGVFIRSAGVVPFTSPQARTVAS